MLAYEHRAEHVGFEPTDAVTRINALAVRPNRPLWQCSARHSTGFIRYLQRRGQPIYGLTCPMRSRRGSNPLIPSSGTRRFSRPVPYRSATAPRQAYRRPSRRFEAISPLDVRSAESLGFEPREPLTRFNGFQDRRIQPLCHDSAERTPHQAASSYYMRLSMCRQWGILRFSHLPAIRLGAPARGRTGIPG